MRGGATRRGPRRHDFRCHPPAPAQRPIPRTPPPALTPLCRRGNRRGETQQPAERSVNCWATAQGQATASVAPPAASFVHGPAHPPSCYCSGTRAKLMRRSTHSASTGRLSARSSSRSCASVHTVLHHGCVRFCRAPKNSGKKGHKPDHSGWTGSAAFQRQVLVLHCHSTLYQVVLYTPPT